MTAEKHDTSVSPGKRDHPAAPSDTGGHPRTARKTAAFLDAVQAVLRASIDGIVITDASQQIVTANDAFCAFLGKRQEDVLETELSAWLEGAGPSRWAELQQRVRSSGVARDVPFEFATPGGTSHLSVNASLLDSSTLGDGDAIISIWRDESPRKRAEEDHRRLLHETRERVKELRGLYAVSTASTESKSLSELFQRASTLIPAAWHYPEITRARITFDDHQHFCEGFQPTPWTQEAEIIVRGKMRGILEVNYLEERPELDEGPFLAEERDLIRGLADLLATAIARIEAEQALKDSERKYRELVELAQEGIWVIDQHSNTTFVNPSMAKMLGYTAEEMCGRHLFAFMDEQGVRIAQENLERRRQGVIEHHDFEFLRKDGDRIMTTMATAPVVDDAGNYRGAIAGLIDVTEKRRLQSNLAQSDRLASMGMLAAGVAHEINNPLSYVLYNLEALSLALPEILERSATGSLPRAEADALQKKADSALHGSRRIAEISRALRTFSRVERAELSEVDLEYAIACAANMARNEIKYRARLVTDYGRVPPLLASEGRVSQVFLNLLINAAHAIDEGDVEHNQITVRTWTEGDGIFAEVADTGSGIPQRTLGRIFEPFFTTKEVGEGSGLGLTLCQTIVREFGGDISVESTVGEGTRFTVRFPVNAEGSTPEKDPEDPLLGPASAPLRGRLLVIDDEPHIRLALASMLDEHDVVTVCSGADGRALLERDPDFDVILCDLMMPDMSGMELHEWLVTRGEGLAQRVIFVTGGAFTPRARKYLRAVDLPVIDKPIDVPTLKKLVDDLISTNRRGS